MMNKIIIPSLLVALVAIAGIFAFAPVEQASTVHTTIQDEAVSLFNVATTPANFDLDNGDILTVTSATNRPFQVFGMQCITADADNTENIGPMTTRIGAANTVTEGAPATTTNDPGQAQAVGLRVNMIPANAAGGYVVPGGQSLFFTIPMDNPGDDDANDSTNCELQIKAASDAAITATFTDTP